MSRFWDISPEGVESIHTLERNMEGCMERLEQAWRELTGAAVEYSEDLGPYADPLNEAIDVMGQLNEVSKESMERLINRLEQYAEKIEEELSTNDL